MGKHGKEVNCSACRGYGQVQQSDDGHVYWVQCQMCSGSGKQPS